MEKKLVQDMIGALRKTGKERQGDDRHMMLGAANYLEKLMRITEDLREEHADARPF